MPFLDHLWAVELVLQPNGHQGWGRQKSESAKDFWGRSVQVTRDVKDRKGQTCGREEMREDRVLGVE